MQFKGHIRPQIQIDANIQARVVLRRLLRADLARGHSPISPWSLRGQFLLLFLFLLRFRLFLLVLLARTLLVVEVDGGVLELWA